MAIAGFVLQIFAAVMLLLFSVRLVRTGIERRFGQYIIRYLTGHGSNITASGSGLALAVVLQSSAAVALLLSGFAATGMLSFPTGLATLLGADLGSALVILLLSFDLTWLQPVLLVVGGWLYLKIDRPDIQHVGRIILGLALILVSLGLLRDAVAPLREAEFLPAMAAYIASDSLTGFLIGAALAFLLHSSVATILMVAALVATTALPFAAGVSLVIGANLGSALIPVWLTRDMRAEPRRIPVANAILRGFAALIALYAIDAFALVEHLLVLSPATSLIVLHIGFNTLLVLLFVPIAGVFEKPVSALMPSAKGEKEAPANNSPLSAFDQSNADAPPLALSAIRQEILQMLQEVERMYRPILALYETSIPAELKAIRDRDDLVNALYTNLRRFMAENARDQFEKPQLKQSRALLEYAIRVEAAGDLVSKRMTDLAREKSETGARFSPAGQDELTRLHALVLAGFGLARHVLLVDDIEAARRLVLDKAEVKRRERASRKAHLKRLETGETGSFTSSDVHLETLRALRELYGHLAAVAYPILYRNGQMLETRLITDLNEATT
mgnify:CR=1 FL=1